MRDEGTSYTSQRHVCVSVHEILYSTQNVINIIYKK